MMMYRWFRKAQRWERRMRRAERLAKKNRDWKEKTRNDELAKLEREFGLRK